MEKTKDENKKDKLNLIKSFFKKGTDNTEKSPEQKKDSNIELYSVISYLYKFINKSEKANNTVNDYYKSAFYKIAPDIQKLLGTVKADNLSLIDEALKNLKRRSGRIISAEIKYNTYDDNNAFNTEMEVKSYNMKIVGKIFDEVKAIAEPKDQKDNYQYAVNLILSALLQFDTADQIVVEIENALKVIDVFPKYYDDFPNQSYFEITHSEGIEIPAFFKRNSNKEYSIYSDLYGVRREK